MNECMNKFLYSDMFYIQLHLLAKRIYVHNLADKLNM
jgi:hypothetical protein